MSAQSASGVGTITFPLMAIYVASRIARDQHRDEDAQSLYQTLVAANTCAEGAALARLAASGMPDSIIPFKRDALDVAAACALICSRTSARFSLFSETAVVDAGYFAITGKSFEYVDRVSDTEKRRVVESDFLPSDRVSGLINAAHLLDERRAMANVPIADDSLLVIDSWAMDACGCSKDSFDVDLSLVNDITSDQKRSSERRVSRARLLRRRDGGLHLITRAESTIQIHAASLAGQWILLDAPEVRLLIQPPDFTQEGASAETWVYPKHLMYSALSGNYSPSVPIDARLAASLMKHHRWCAPQDAADWLAGIVSGFALRS